MTCKKEYKVLIAEDEILQRENIANKIESFSDSFKVVFQAANGEEALEYLKKNEVDIVFTDIVMPVMNGIDFLSSASKLKPGINYVILSGYSEFKYAQKAMQYGVKDYLLKPVMRDEMHAVLNRISCQDDMLVKPQREINIKALLSSKLQHSFLSSFKEDLFHIALIDVGHYVANYSYIQEFEDAFDSFWSDMDVKRCIEAEADAMGISVPYFFASENFNECYIVFVNEELSPKRFREFIERVLNRINKRKTFPPAAVTICENALAAEELYQCARTLRKLYNEKYVPWKPRINSYNKQRADATLLNRSIFAVDTDAAVRAFSMANMNEAKERLKDMLSSWESLNIPVYQYYQNLVYFLKSIHTKCSVGAADGAWEVLQRNAFFHFGVSFTLSDFTDNLLDSLFVYCRMGEINKSMDSLLYQVKKYLDQNFCEYVNVYDIAEKYGISYSYLSRRFKESYGKSPINYIIDKRIDKAIAQMKANPELELKQISELAGYTDYFYFSKLFKKCTGYSPSNYRKRAEGREV